MASSICTIDGYTLPISGTTGHNVAPSSTITIALSNTSGVTNWSINCTSYDGINSNGLPATINNTKIVDPVNFSATFTGPALTTIDGYAVGSALQFTSIVNQGMYNQAITTMGVFVLGATGVRMLFNGENLESDATNGVATDINYLNTIGSVLSIKDATTSTVGVIQLTHDLGGTATSPNVVQLSGSAGNTLIASGLLFTTASPLIDTNGGTLTIANDGATTFLLDGDNTLVTCYNNFKQENGVNIQDSTGNALFSSGTNTTSVGAVAYTNSLIGGRIVTTRTITGDLTVDTTTKDFQIFCNFSVSHTVTLPAPSNGRVLVITDIGFNLSPTITLTIARHASEKINGTADSYIASAPGFSVTLTSNGTDWFFVA